MSRTKRLILAVLAGVAMPVLATSAALAQDKNILMVLWKGWMPADQAFAAKLKEAGTAVRFTEVNADQDRTKLATEIRAMEKDIAERKFDLIYTYGTVATQMTRIAVRNETPILFNIVFDPVGSNLVKSAEQPGENITGITNGVPIPDQFSAFTKLKPIQTLTVLFNSREPNSNIIERQVQDWAKGAGVTVVSRRVTPGTTALAEVLDEIRSGKIVTDSLYAGADNYLASVAREIQQAIGDKVRLFGGTQTYVQAGWLAAYTPANSAMGVTAAEQAIKILAGAKPGSLPVILPKPMLFLSKDAAAKHGIVPPEDAAVSS